MAVFRYPLMLTRAPCPYLFSQYRATAVTRTFTSSTTLSEKQQPSLSNQNPSSSLFGSGPSPPRLSKEEQDIFEELQRQSTGAFSTPRSPPSINQSPDSSPTEKADADAIVMARVDKIGEKGQEAKFKDEFERVIEARGKGEELHPNVRRGAQPEFEGDINPDTGEVGGPKNNPLRWGAAGEWTYNGRATDF